MIVGLNITKMDIQAYNYGKFTNVEVKHELRMDKPPMIVTQPTSFGDKNILRVEFQLSISYSPNLGYMIFSGIVDYLDDNHTIIKNEWDNSQSVTVVKTKSDCANAILQNVIPIALLLSNRINLPPVVQIPMINFSKPKTEKEEMQNYIG